MIYIVAISLGLAGCAGLKESIILGASSGAATGAIAGANINKRNKKAALQGAVVGGVIGGVASYFIHKGLKNRDSNVRKNTLFNLDKYGVSGPTNFSSGRHGITTPTVESEWIDTKVKGNKLIEGHRIWLITDDPKWIPNIKTKRSK